MDDTSADITVVGLVHESHIIEDIGIIVPKGEAVTIPGHLMIRSKDLYRSLSMHTIMKIHQPPTALQNSTVSKAEATRLQAEVARLLEQNSALTQRNKVVEADLDAAKVELAKMNAESGKLDAILAAIKDRPTVINQVIQSAKDPSLPKEEMVSGDAPHFIPSQIRNASDSTGDERVEVQETTSDTSSVSEAASKLSALRKKGKAQ